MLKGVVGLITGSASGLGRATVNHLLKQGASVVLIDLPDSKGKEIAEELDGDSIYSPGDVFSEGDVTKALEECRKKFGKLDLVVNCAGISRAFKIANPRRDNTMSEKEIQDVMQTNLFGTFNVTRLAVQFMSKHNAPTPPDDARGVIVNVGSLFSEDGNVGQSLYSASKAAVTSMTLPLARELAHLGIRVVTISPGLMETPLTSASCLTEEVRSYLVEQTPFPKRFGHPEEFAQMVESVYRNPMLNGVNIKLTGGLRQHVYTKLVSGIVEEKRPPGPLQRKLKNLG